MPALEAEQRFHKYKIIEKLGSSLAGDSYRAEDLVIRREVTLKLIQPGKILPESARRQFFREMQGISSVSHPSLTPLLDYGENDGQLYIARQYLASGSLLGNEGRSYFKPILTVPNAINYTHQLARGLHALHTQGFVHGSLTLSNIMILHTDTRESANGDASFQLADMNITHFVRRFGQLSNQILPITSAPEQRTRRMIPASDQFALAVILYFWLTGRFPYLGTPVEIERQKLAAKIPPLFNLNAKVSSQQEGILRRALSVNPEERYPTILAFSTALTNTLSMRQPSPVSLPAQNGKAAFMPFNSPELLIQPQPDPAPATEPQPVPETTPAPTPQPQPDPMPTPEPDPAPTPEPVPVPEPVPEPAPAPTPEPQPAPPPLPMPEPQPTPQPAPEPKILPEKDPTSPETQPQPEPGPFPKPEPNPVPMPDPEIVPQPAPEINPGPLGTPPPETPFNPQAITEAVSAPQEHQPALDATPKPEQAEPGSDDPVTTLPRLLISSPYTETPYFVTLENELLTLGRAGASDILLDKDPLTSRHHALLRREDQGYVLLDRQSATGIKVNDRQLDPEEAYPLVDEDMIRIGNYTLTFFAANSPRLTTASSVQTAAHSLS